ncbi:hypothetical protein QAD02_012814 [Eretmocerus hayati]|uniref:Uncharacterized protein n=1 Tax=Eretmocerus hayati TaxID=131215 RepID=A0ACC2P0X8_9HYME|nr:hypothetical protein QAD02_012814 [Eretmocerus hayati]
MWYYWSTDTSIRVENSDAKPNFEFLQQKLEDWNLAITKYDNSWSVPRKRKDIQLILDKIQKVMERSDDPSGIRKTLENVRDIWNDSKYTHIILDDSPRTDASSREEDDDPSGSLLMPKSPKQRGRPKKSRSTPVWKEMNAHKSKPKKARL